MVDRSALDSNGPHTNSSACNAEDAATATGLKAPIHRAAL